MRCGSLRRTASRAGVGPRSEPVDAQAPSLGAAALSRARSFLGGLRARRLRRTADGARGEALAFPAGLGQADRDRLPAPLDLAASSALSALARAPLALAHLPPHP